MADGSMHRLCYALEATRGVTPATPVFKPWRYKSPCNIGLTKGTLESEEMRDDRQYSDVRHGARQIGGDTALELSYGSYDDILEAVLCGTWDADSPAAGTDRLVPGKVRRFYTIERYFSDLAAGKKPYHRYTGCEFSQLNLAINANAMITGSVSVVGKDMADPATAIIAGATYPAALTTSPLDSFTGLLEEGGGSSEVVTEIQLTLDNKMDPRFVVGANTSILPSIGRINVSGSINAFFEDTAFMEKFLNELDSSLEVNLPDGAGNNIRLFLPRIKYNASAADVKNENAIVLSMPFRALLDPTTGTNLIIDRTPA